MAHWSDRLTKMGACAEAVAWASTQPSLKQAWKVCKRGDWMFWLAGRIIGTVGSFEHRRVVKAAAACARLALPLWEAKHPNDTRPKDAIIAAERWAKNPTAENGYYAASSSSAAYAASAAASAASANAAYAAYAAAANAAYAAYSDYASAAYAASAAAHAAAYADYAYADYASAAYAASARKRSLSRSASIVRRLIPCPTLARVAK